MDKYVYNYMYIFSFCYSLLGNRWNCFSVLSGLARERVKRRLILNITVDNTTLCYRQHVACELQVSKPGIA